MTLTNLMTLKIIELNQEMGANAISLSEIEKEIRKIQAKFYKFKKTC